VTEFTESGADAKDVKVLRIVYTDDRSRTMTEDIDIEQMRVLMQDYEDWLQNLPAPVRSAAPSNFAKAEVQQGTSSSSSGSGSVSYSYNKTTAKPPNAATKSAPTATTAATTVVDTAVTNNVTQGQRGSSDSVFST
jgi:hypothetical protein